MPEEPTDSAGGTPAARSFEARGSPRRDVWESAVRRAFIPLGLLRAALCLPAWAQSYSIDWYTIDGGGGTSTGGVYSVTGTIGQPDAGTMSGGNFTLQGGFWGIISAVQTPGTAYLTVFRTATNSAVVSWPLTGTEGWGFQATNALSNVAAPWPVIPPPYQTNGGSLQFAEPAPVATSSIAYTNHDRKSEIRNAKSETSPKSEIETQESTPKHMETKSPLQLMLALGAAAAATVAGADRPPFLWNINVWGINWS